MMSTFWIFLLLSSSFCAVNGWNVEETSTEYDEHDDESYPEKFGQNYKQQHQQQQQQQQQQMQYSYKMQTSSGIAPSTQRGGFRLQSKIQLVRAGAETWLLKLTGLTFGKINGPLLQPNLIGKNEQFQAVNADQRLTKLLELPVKFSQKNGRIYEVLFDGEDEPWSTNIKRGALNMFQVNFDVEKQDDFSTSGHASKDAIHEKFYNTLEESVEGECQTSYAVKPTTSDNAGAHKAYSVTKSINFDSCLRRPNVAYNVESLEICSPDSATRRDSPLRSSSITKYSIIGKPSRFLIVSAEGESRYSADALGSDPNAFIVNVNQELKLIQSNGGTAVSETSRMKKSATGLIYSTEWDSEMEKSFMSGKTTGRKEHQFGQWKSPVIVENAKKALDRLLVSSRNDAPADTVAQLVELLRFCKPEDLNRLEEMCTKSKDGSNKGSQFDLFTHMLGVCGSKACVQKLASILKRDSVSVPTAIFSLKQLANTPLSSEAIVREILNLAQHYDKMLQTQQLVDYFLKQTLWFLSGTLINKLCTTNGLNRLAINQDSETAACSSEIKKHFVELIAGRLRGTTDWEESLIYTKALGNAGLLESVPVLENMIKRQSRKDEFVRNSAIYALRKMLSMRPKKIASILMPIINDPEEKMQIRISAVNVILSVDVDATILSQLDQISRSDPDSNLGNFIRSGLNAIAKKKSVCRSKRAPYAKPARRTTDNEPARKPLNHVGAFSFGNPALGADVDFQWPANSKQNTENDRLKMSHHSLNIHTSFYELRQKYALAMGIVSAGPADALKNVLNSLFGSESTRNKGQRWMDDTEDSWEQPWHTDEFEENSEFVNVNENHWLSPKKESRDDADSSKRLKSVIYLQLKDQSTILVPFSDRVLRNVQSSLKSPETDLKRGLKVEFVKPMVLDDILFKLPVASGLPLSFSLKSIIMPKVNLTVRTEKMPQSAQTFAAQFDLYSSISEHKVVEMKIWSPIVYHGVKFASDVKLDLNNNLKLESSWTKGAYVAKISVKVPNQTTKLIGLDSKRSTYARDWNDVAPATAEREKIIKSANNEQSRTTTCYEEALTGSQLCLKSSGAGRSFFPYIEGDTEITLEPKSRSSQELIVRVILHPQSYADGKTGKKVVDQVKIESVLGQRRFSANAKYSRDLVGPYKAVQAILTKSLSADTKTPALTCFDAEIGKADGDRSKLTVSSALHWGSTTCASDQYVVLKGSFNASSRRGNTEQYYDCTGGDYCHKDETGRSSSSIYPKGVSGGLFEVSYNKMPVEWQNMTNKLYRIFKHVMFEKSDVAQINVRNPYNKVIIKFEEDPEAAENYYDVNVKTPNENATFSAVELPSWVLPDVSHDDPYRTSPEMLAHKKRPSGRKESYDSDFEEDNFDYSEEDEDGWYSDFEQELHHDYDPENEADQEVKGEIIDNDPFDGQREEKLNQNRYQRGQHKVKELRRERPSLGLSEHAPWAGKRLKREDSDEEEDDNWSSSSGWGWKDDRRESEQRHKAPKAKVGRPNTKESEEVDEKDKAQKPNVRQPNTKESRFSTEKLHYAGQRNGFCQIAGKTVKNVHGVGYLFPFPKCFTIISKDCTSQRRFIIMMKKADSENDDMKDLFILTRKHKILIPASSKERLSLNDAPLTLEDNRPTSAPDSKDLRFTKAAQLIKVELIDLGLTVMFDGSSADIKFSDQIAGQQCGLCGQPNDGQNDHSKWPDTSNPSYLKDLVTKYVILDDKCHPSSKDRKPTKPEKPNPSTNRPNNDRRDKMPDRKDKSSDNHDRWTNEDNFNRKKNENKQTKFLDKTDVIEMGNKICISTETIRSCPDDSYAITEVLKRVSYFCLSSTDPMANTLKKKAVANESINRMKGVEANMVRTVPVATDCAKF